MVPASALAGANPAQAQSTTVSVGRSYIRAVSPASWAIVSGVFIARRARIASIYGTPTHDTQPPRSISPASSSCGEQVAPHIRQTGTVKKSTATAGFLEPPASSE